MALHTYWPVSETWNKNKFKKILLQSLILMLQFRDIISLCLCQFKVLFTGGKDSSKHISSAQLGEYTDKEQNNCLTVAGAGSHKPGLPLHPWFVTFAHLPRSPHLQTLKWCACSCTRWWWVVEWHWIHTPTPLGCPLSRSALSGRFHSGLWCWEAL